MKYTTAALIAGVLCASVLTGCGSKKNAAQETQTAETSMVNTSYEENKPLYTVKGEEIQPDDERLSLFYELGFGMLVPESWDNMLNLNFVMTSDSAYCISYIPSSIMPDLMNMTQEEMEQYDFESLYAKQIYAAKIMYVAEGTSEDEVKKQNSEYQTIEKLGTLNGNTYYMAYNSSISEKDYPGMEKSDIEEYASFASAFETIKDNIVIFPIEEAESGTVSNESLQSFQAVDMQGNPVDASIFAGYDLTVVNIWSTWCGPCVEEMPDLAKLQKDLPENVNLITICTDGDQSKEAAEAVLKESGAEFVTVCGEENLRNGMLKDIYAYPTTIFVDKDGATVGDPFVGGAKYDAYMNEINERLNK